MKKKNIFDYDLWILDKDGTLIESVSGKQFVQNPEDQKLLPNVVDLLEKFQKNPDKKVSVATNQGGVEYGYKTMQEAIDECIFFLGLLPDTIDISHCLMCPSYDGIRAWDVKPDQENRVYKASQNSEEKYGRPFFRKPGPGMMLLPATKLDIQPEKVLVVGDRPEDKQAAFKAGFDFLEAETWRSVQTKPVVS